jgi:signal transduction histidine kinase/DNA-binding response OmpR family regulator
VNTKPIRVLLVEDNPGDARLIREMLAAAGPHDFAVRWVSRLADGLEHLGQNQIDVVLLDLGLPDSQGLDTFIKARERAPQVPFVVLTGLFDEDLALTAVQKGAQDYLFKGETNSSLLWRAIRYATERKQAELALEAERNKLYAVLNSLPVFVHLKGSDFTIRFANRRFIEYFGEPAQRHCYEVLRRRSEPCENCLALEALKTKTPQKFELTDPVSGRTFEVYNYPFCTADDLLVLSLGIDITERQQAEEAIRDQQQQLTTIYESAPLIMMLVDRAGHICKANKLAAQCSCVADTDLVGQRVGEALHCLHAISDPQGCGFGLYCQTCPVRGTIIDTLETGVSHYQVEASRPLVLDGKTQEVTFLLCTARLSDRGQPQVLVTIQNITERKRTEEALRLSQENLRYLASQLLHAQERERLRIAHELHDDLGQSLMLLKMQISGLSRDLPLELEEPRQLCFNSIDTVQDIIDSLRHLSHGLIPPTLTEIGLRAAINDLLEEFRRHRGIVCSLDMDDIKGLFSSNTELLIYRILQESLTNIAKYSQATEVSVSIKRKEHQVWFSVEDNGLGFEVDKVQARRDRKRGLGLASMEERARMMGGTFHLWSKPRQGTKIHITIPLGH